MDSDRETSFVFFIILLVFGCIVLLVSGISLKIHSIHQQADIEYYQEQTEYWQDVAGKVGKNYGDLFHDYQNLKAAYEHELDNEVWIIIDEDGNYKMITEGELRNGQ